MVLRLSGLPILLFAAVVWAQQSGTGDSRPATPSDNSKPADSSASKPAQQTSQSTSNPADKSQDDSLKFPEEEPTNATPVPAAPARNPDLAPPRSDRVRAQDLAPTPGESSSKDAPIDLAPPTDDSKAHPQSSEAVANAEADSLKPGGVTELHAWDPHKAAKDVEVGDFYFKRGNYRAAEARYRDALLYKDNDAVATIKLAVCLEKLGILDDARAEYESYLRILPRGPQAAEAQKSLARLKSVTSQP